MLCGVQSAVQPLRMAGDMAIKDSFTTVSPMKLSAIPEMCSAVRNLCSHSRHEHNAVAGRWMMEVLRCLGLLAKLLRSMVIFKIERL